MAITAQSNQEIVNDIVAHMQKGGGAYRDWYVGISKDARARLSNHGVREGDWWIFCQATSSANARAVEKYFLESVGTDGGPGGGDDSADQVYAYKKARHTRP